MPSDAITASPVTCTATKQYDATPMDGLKSHATVDREHPLCTQTLNVLTYDYTAASAENVDCKRCLKRLDTGENR